MTSNPNTMHPEAVVPISDVPHAPFMFYEDASLSGHLNGIINITLSAHRDYVGPDGGIITDHVVVGYLRGNILAAIGLRNALNKALLAAAPTAGGVQ